MKIVPGVWCMVIGTLCLTAESKPTVFDLGNYKEMIAGFEKVESDAKAKTMEKAKAKMARLVLELRTCADEDFEAKIKETRAFIGNGGDLPTAEARVEFLLSVAETGGAFACPDVEKLAEAEAKRDAKARMRYVQMMLKRCRPMREDFSYARSNDRRLDIVDAALADPMMEASRVRLLLARFAVLRDLGRKDEAEKLAIEQAEATDNAGLKRSWYGALAAAYTADARRYAEKPSPAILRKAEDMHMKIVELAKDGRSPEDLLAIAQIRLETGDLLGAKAFVARSREGTASAEVKRRGELILGNAAYECGDWSEAGDRFLALFDPQGRNDHDLTVRTVQALFAAGRRREALPLVKWLSEEKGGRYKLTREQFARLLRRECPDGMK